VSQASLHNESNIRRLAASCPQGLLGKSDKILVSRRNDVIPYVEKVVAPSKRERLMVPKECPSCGMNLTKTGEYLVCTNERGCPAQQSGAVKRWVKKLDLKGWGDTLVETLCESGMVGGVADLYGLDTDELADLTLSGKKVGKSTATKVLKNLQAKMSLSITDFVGSLGIDLWGRSMVKLIVQAGFDTLEKMEDASVAQIASVPGVGDTKAAAFVSGFKYRRKVIDELLAAGVKVKKPVTGGKLSGVSFCFTGIRDRAFEAEIEEAGGTVKSGVGKGLTYLVAKSKSGSSAKLKKAEAQGVQVLTLEEAKALL
jgi:DNA ligase (NAD+)